MPLGPGPPRGRGRRRARLRPHSSPAPRPPQRRLQASLPTAGEEPPEQPATAPFPEINASQARFQVNPAEEGVGVVFVTCQDCALNSAEITVARASKSGLAKIKKQNDKVYDTSIHLAAGTPLKNK